MSLIIDLLRRLKTQNDGKRSSVYPLLASRDTNNSKRTFILIISTLSILLAIVAYFGVQYLLSLSYTPTSTYTKINPANTNMVPRNTRPTKDANPTTSLTVSETEVDSNIERTSPDKVKEDSKVQRHTDIPNQNRATPVKEEIDRKELMQAKKSKVGGEMDKLVEDIRAVSKSSAYKPNSSVIIVLKADEYVKKGMILKAIDMYEKAISVFPDKKVANNLLVLYAKAGRYKDAEKLLSKFKDEYLISTYMIELVRLGRGKEALRLAEKYEHLDERGRIHFAVALAYEKLKDFRRALREYKMAYIKDMSDPYYAYNYARMLERFGRLKDAYNLYLTLQGHNLDPDMKSVVTDRVEFLKRSGFR